MSTPENRSTMRKALATLLTELATAAQVVYDHMVLDFGGQSPTVCVTSAASDRKRLTLGDTRGQATFALDIHTFTLYRDDAAGWTPANAEDTLDELEQQIATILLAHPRTTAWKAIAYAEPSQARDLLTLSGGDYLHEVITVAVSAY